MKMLVRKTFIGFGIKSKKSDREENKEIKGEKNSPFIIKIDEAIYYCFFVNRAVTSAAVNAVLYILN